MPEEIPETFVYITSTPSGNYHVRIRNTVEEYITDLNRMDEVGDQKVKLFRVPLSLAKPTIEACSEFIAGKFSLEGLETKVASLLK